MRRRNPDSETAILSPLIEFLEICSNQERLRYFRAHPVRLFTTEHGVKTAKVRPSQRGAPDIFVWLAKERLTCWIEGKARKGTQSSDQIKWAAFAIASGIEIFVPRSHGDVNAIIKWIRERI